MRSAQPRRAIEQSHCSKMTFLTRPSGLREGSSPPSIPKWTLEPVSVVERLERTGLLSRKTAIAVDQAGISEIVDELSRRGIDPELIGGAPQGWKLNNAIKTTERKTRWWRAEAWRLSAHGICGG